MTFDVTKEPLASYWNRRTVEKKESVQDNEPDIKEKEAEIKKALRKWESPLNDLLANGEGAKLSATLYREAIAIARSNGDGVLMSRLAAAAEKATKDDVVREQMVKTEEARERIALEKAERLKIENEYRRGQYIDRDVVKLIFGRVYAVHTNNLQPMGMKLAPSLAAIPDGPNKEITMREFIDKEIYAALGSIQRLLIEEIGN